MRIVEGRYADADNGNHTAGRGSGGVFLDHAQLWRGLTVGIRAPAAPANMMIGGVLVELYSPIREEFFRWCDQTVAEAVSSPGKSLNYWRPQKRASGHGYDLVFEIGGAGQEPKTHVIPIPDKYTDLLDREYPSHDDGED
ncbi:hypothetical protein [Candidatus Desulforudis audaxviator]|uniref:hypothetical protein n=1 Tax=Candidatus Desulforudis audaxviator TaxID=471827 RepID=UPI00140F7618|nr:hypothetical protein [Candidatus Desulforudis audaxviator]